MKEFVEDYYDGYSIFQYYPRWFSKLTFYWTWVYYVLLTTLWVLYYYEKISLNLYIFLAASIFIFCFWTAKNSLTKEFGETNLFYLARSPKVVNRLEVDFNKFCSEYNLHKCNEDRGRTKSIIEKLNREAKSYKFNSYIYKAVPAAVLLPIWSNYITKYLNKPNSDFVYITALGLVISIGLILAYLIFKGIFKGIFKDIVNLKYENYSALANRLEKWYLDLQT